MLYSIYAESTPNPEVMKFVSNRMLADKSLEVLDASQAKKIPLANELFKLPFIKSVFISSNFVSITKMENVNWNDAGNIIVADNHQINEAIHLFEKIEDDKRKVLILSSQDQSNLLTSHTF